MKRKFKYQYIVMGFVLLLIYSCKKDNTTTIQPPNDGIIFNPNLTYVSMTDIDGNIYKTIKIGTQCWMAENLKTTKFNIGTAIPLLTNDSVWYHLTSPAYYWYNNDIKYKPIYGALYNWYTVNTVKLSPKGWHEPSETDYALLLSYLGGDYNSGAKLKEVGITHWLNYNPGSTNETGFTALPGGNRYEDGTFDYLGYFGGWWTSTSAGLAEAFYHYTYSNIMDFNGGWNSKLTGRSVRFVKDE